MEHPRIMHTALDATDVPALAGFWAQLLGLHPRPGDEGDTDWVVLLDAGGRRALAINRVVELTPASWPSDDVPKQAHLDLRVETREELEHHRARAEALGATVRLDRTTGPDGEDEPLYVLSDPAGHPFCLMVNPG